MFLPQLGKKKDVPNVKTTTPPNALLRLNHRLKSSTKLPNLPRKKNRERKRKKEKEKKTRRLLLTMAVLSLHT